MAIAPERPDESIHLLGAGLETAVMNDSYDPHEPAFDDPDWEMNQ